MAISSQLPPQLALAIRQGALQTLALQAGQVVEAKVLGATPNGVTQLQIGQQTLNVTLPTQMPAGTLLSLLAQGSGSQQKLVLVQAQAGGSPPAQIIPQALTAPQAPIPSGMVAQRPAMVLPVPSTVVQSLGLQAGQRVEARVLGPGPNGAVQVRIGRQMLAVNLPTPPPAGTVLPLQVQGNGAQQVLVLLPPATQTGRVQANAGAVSQPPVNLGTPSTAPTATPQAIGSAQAQPGSSPPGAPRPSPPQAALTEMVQAAVQRQDSVSNLITVLAATLGKVPLPQPVMQAAQQVLAANVPLTAAMDGAALQKAMAASGIFQEAALGQGTPELARSDLKTGLLTLRNVLVSWLGQAAAIAAPLGPLPPPVRGALLRAKPGGTGPLDMPDTPIEAGKLLLERTEGSLARLRLHQHASLPDQAVARAPADWSMDIPVLIGGYQSVLQLQIHRDEAGASQQAAERGWQIRFAMDLPVLGEVGAQVGLRGGTTSVRLWASDAQTAQDFEQAVPELVQGLAAAGLRPGIIVVRADDSLPNPPATGHFVDALR
ncbi:MAG TPA: flagellar hook-length control protein FliK [Devosia sp.]|nr:flagellar hook-length control protein FliK [Devosia sp.]